MSNLNLNLISRPVPEIETRKGYLRLDRNERTSLIATDEFVKLIKTISPSDLTPYSVLEPFYLDIVKWLKIKRDQLLLTHGSEQGINKF